MPLILWWRCNYINYGMPVGQYDFIAITQTISTILDIKYRCSFLFVRYKRQFCTELVSWEHKACPLSGIKKVRSWEVAFVYLHSNFNPCHS